MKKIFLTSLFLFLLSSNLLNAAMLFPGKDNQETVIENGVTCVPENSPYWREGYPCCEGLTSYLKPGYFGHPSCKPVSEAIIGNLIYQPVLWLIYGLIIIFILTILKFRKKSKN